MMEQIQLFLAGDSTVADCPPHEAPMAGWGQPLQFLFTSRVLIQNEAAGGRSSTTFIREGRLQQILDRIRPGDYIFVQFGHNDQKAYGTEPFTTYQAALAAYVQGARGRGAQAVLLTPVHRRSFDEAGRVVDTHGDYPRAMRELAEELSVPLIDLTEKTKVLYESLGEEESKRLFTWISPGVHPNYPDGIEDNTHFCEYGAYQIARLVAAGICELRLPLMSDIKEGGLS